MSVKVYGKSGDCVELTGAIRGEFQATEGKPFFIAFSDGTVISVVRTDDGYWRVKRIEKGLAQYSKIEAERQGTENYSDVVEIWGVLVKWAVVGDVFMEATQ